MRIFPLYQHVKSTIPHKILSIDELVDMIKNNDTLKIRTQHIREVYKPKGVEGRELYEQFKDKCESFIPAGRFEDGKRKETGLIEHNGYIVIDIDDIPEYLIDDIRATINLLSHTMLSFISPSGLGIKVITPVTPFPTSAEEHRHAWAEASKVYNTAIQLPVDPSGKNVSRMCVLMHDPDLYYNKEANPIQWEVPKVRRKNRQQVKTDKEKLDMSAIDYISADEYQTWLEIGMALKHEGFSYEDWIAWSQTSAKYDNHNNEYLKRWEGFNSDNLQQVTWGTVLKTATEGGYTPPIDDTPKRKRKRKETPPEAILEDSAGIIFTDNWNADRFYSEYQDTCRFCTDWGKWALWHRGYWREDKTLDIFKRGRRIVKQMYKDAMAESDPDKRLKFLKHSTSTDSKKRITDMLDIAKALLACTNEEFDTEKTDYLFNVKNGTVNLETGVLTEHDQSNLITKIAPFKYETHAECPKWVDFLGKIFDNNVETIGFIQRALGYSATADISEQCLFFCYGTGANGKTLFLETIMRLMGTYAMTAAPEILIQKRMEDHPTAVADLNGKRFVSTIEVGENRYLHEAKVKMLTGGDRIKARYMRKDFFEFSPTHKLWMAANHKPIIRGNDEGIWRRIHLIPFNVTIPKEDQIPLKVMLKNFKDENAGIFRWMLDGAKAWKDQGLLPSDSVVDATKEYRNESDVLSEFFAECCLIDRRTMVTSTDMYHTYVRWCETNHEKRTLTRRQLAARLVSEGYNNAKKRVNGKPTIVWEGIGLLETNYNDPDASTVEKIIDDAIEFV